MKARAVLAAILCLSLLLASCWVPEHYVSRIRIERDGSYKLYVEGTAANPEAWRALKRLEAEERGGKLKPDDLKKRREEILAKFHQVLETDGKDPRVMSASSIGDGRVRFTLGGVWSLDRSLLISSELTSPIAYAVGADGAVRIRVKDAVHSDMARGLGLRTEGDLSVSVAEGIEVLEHNAQRTPTSPVGAYRWRIDEKSAEPPYLKLRFPAEGPREPAAKGQGGSASQKGLAHH